MTSIVSSDFHFLVPEIFQKNLVQIGTVVSEKIQFEYLYVRDLGPRSRNDLDLQYLHIFIYSIRCLLLLTCRSLAAIVSEKSTVFTFSHRFWRRIFLKSFYHIWAWRPSWSCDPHAANKISFFLPKEAPHKIWL